MIETEPQTDVASNPGMDLLVDAVVDGDETQAVAVANDLRNAGVTNEEIVNGGVEVAMGKLDEKCTVEHFNLLEIMLSGRAVTGVMKELFPPGTEPPQTNGTVAVATLEGDVHDLGKTVVKTVLTARGYKVIDCGKDCPLDTVVDTAKQEGAFAVGVSGLITSVIPQVSQVKNKLAESGLGHVTVFAGGAALKQASTDSLNVDFVARTAFDGLHYLDEISGGAK